MHINTFVKKDTSKIKKYYYYYCIHDFFQSQYILTFRTHEEGKKNVILI
jgi:hypothetical protein